MDCSEYVIQKALSQMGFSKIVYEPDGNIPPDFVVNNEIAVEVRRLNQNFDNGIVVRGLEETAIPLGQRVTRLVESISRAEGNSWFVWLTFSRPVPRWGSMEHELRNAFLEFKRSTNKKEKVIYSAQNLQVKVYKASEPLKTFFRMGGISDRQAGGWVVSELISNIKHCASEKLQKTEPYRTKYKAWWLALTNHTGFSIDERDRRQLKQHLPRPEGWDKILLVNPNNPAEWIEI